MTIGVNLDYYYGSESSQFSFFRIPRQLMTGKRFRRLSTEAKLLYGLLLDRMGLSVSAPVRFCNFSPDWECQKKAGKGMQSLNNYTCRFRPSSLKCTDKSGLDGLQADE